MLITKITKGTMSWIAALLLVVPAISMAQQIVVNSGYPLPTSGNYPFGITHGPDGALWFANDNTNSIGRITRAGAVTLYPLPSSGINCPQDITAGPDGALWYTDFCTNWVGRITTAGVVTTFPLAGSSRALNGITAGPDGALWFTESDGNNIGRITTAGVITEYPVPTAFASPWGITAGPDGALWFTEAIGNNIGRITTSGAITEYPVPTAGYEGWAITTGPDGALWFTEYSGGKIGRITTAGAVTEYPAHSPHGITAGPDGALWFTEFPSRNKIGRITTSGVITEYPVPIANAGLSGFWGITLGHDGGLWFTEEYDNRIGEVLFPTANLTVSPASGTYKANLSFAGSGFAPNENVRVYKSGVGSAVLAGGTADSSGSFTAAGRVPQASFGPRLFLAVGQTSGRLGAANFSTSPQLLLNPTLGPVGTTVTAVGTGFGSLEQVNIYWPNPNIQLGTVTADVNGTFSGSTALTFTVPSGAPSGTNMLDAMGTITKAIVYASFTVQ